MDEPNENARSADITQRMRRAASNARVALLHELAPLAGEGVTYMVVVSRATTSPEGSVSNGWVGDGLPSDEAEPCDGGEILRLAAQLLEHHTGCRAALLLGDASLRTLAEETKRGCIGGLHGELIEIKP